MVLINCYIIIYMKDKKVKHFFCFLKEKSCCSTAGFSLGALEGTRTPDPLLRRQLLYPPELQTHILERVMGVEPTQPAWKAGILPLNYTRGATKCILASFRCFVNNILIFIFQILYSTLICSSETNTSISEIFLS